MCSSFSRAPEAKKQAILKAAVDIVAEQGLTASTRQIAQEAGVSEGTIFNHFSHKDDLLNALYLYIKNDLADYAAKERLRILTGRAPTTFNAAQDGWKGLHDRLRLLWDSYLNWGLLHPSFVKTLERLAPTGRIKLETRLAALKLFPVFAEFLSNLWTLPEGEDISKQWEDLFLYRSLMALGNQTIEAMHDRAEVLGAERAKADQRKIREVGFSMLWNSVVAIIKAGLLSSDLNVRGKAIFTSRTQNNLGGEASNDLEGEVSILHQLNKEKSDSSALISEEVGRLEALL